MDKDKVTYQMAFDFNSTLKGAYSMVENVTEKKFFSSADVISIQDVFTKREEEKQASLYNQIASSVSHLY